MWIRRAFLLIVLLALPLPALAGCAPGSVDLRGPWGQARFTVEIADTPQAMARGLMYRESLPASGGMLFVYPTPRRVAFWMKNTRIPLDMLFFDGRGRLVRIHENAVPMDETPIPGGDDIKAVLEINGGMSRALGLTIGSTARHPAFAPETALWPCAKP